MALFTNAVNNVINTLGPYLFISLYADIAMAVYYKRNQLWGAINGVSHFAPESVISLRAP